MGSETASLFVIALPRTMSSLVYHESRAALDLREPVWTSEGEVLNNDRFVMYGGPTVDSGVKYVTRGKKTRAQFDKIVEFLDQIVAPRGFAYKDVVNPFVT